jgi:hypothetical protein
MTDAIEPEGISSVRVLEERYVALLEKRIASLETLMEKREIEVCVQSVNTYR